MIQPGMVVYDRTKHHAFSGRVLAVDGSYAWVLWIPGYRTTVEVSDLVVIPGGVID